MANRKTYRASFKKKVALEAIKDRHSLAELSQRFGVHSSQIKQWKDILLKESDLLFERKNKAEKAFAGEKKKTDELLRIIGKLQVENEYLKKSMP